MGPTVYLGGLSACFLPINGETEAAETALLLFPLPPPKRRCCCERNISGKRGEAKWRRPMENCCCTLPSCTESARFHGGRDRDRVSPEFAFNEKDTAFIRTKKPQLFSKSFGSIA